MDFDKALFSITLFIALKNNTDLYRHFETFLGSALFCHCVGLIGLWDGGMMHGQAISVVSSNQILEFNVFLLDLLVWIYNAYLVSEDETLCILLSTDSVF